jgi:hypothetical protein
MHLERVHQVGHYPELHKDTRSTKHKKRKNYGLVQCAVGI